MLTYIINAWQKFSILIKTSHPVIVQHKTAPIDSEAYENTPTAFDNRLANCGVAVVPVEPILLTKLDGFIAGVEVTEKKII